MSDDILQDLWFSRNPEYLYFQKIFSETYCLLEGNEYRYVYNITNYVLFCIKDNEIDVEWTFYCDFKLLFKDFNTDKMLDVFKFFIPDKVFDYCRISTADKMKIEFVGIFWIEIHFNNGNKYEKECIKYEDFYVYEDYYSISGSKYKKDSISYIKIINYESKTTEES